VAWVGSSRQDLRRLPDEVQDGIGYVLHEVQEGGYPPEAKPQRGDLSGIMELRIDSGQGTFRAVYTLKLRGFIYVLHVFQKKSTSGIATSRRDVELIKARLARARVQHAAQETNSEETR
jgi:phage-related protein